MSSYLYPKKEENYVKQPGVPVSYSRRPTANRKIRFEHYEAETPLEPSPVSPFPEQQTETNMVWKTEKVSTYDPKVWGPAFWFSLHTSAAYYPEDASPLVRERMKQRILAIPYEIPCKSCMTHASSFIEEKRDKLDEIVSNRHSLGKFYVEFHNKVNKRFGKPEWTYEQAYAKYSGVVEVTYLKH
jgi:hypothetical protein